MISWGSRRQDTVALSTTESEFMAACSAVQELIWVHRLVNNLFEKVSSETPILLVDNQSAIKLIKNPQFHRRTKHIDIKFNFIREKFDEKFFEINYVGTNNQEADLLTKPLNRKRFESLRKMIGVYNKVQYLSIC